MDYQEVRFHITPVDPGRDLLAAELGDLGYESFVEEGEELLAYIPVDQFQTKALDHLQIAGWEGYSVTWTDKLIPGQNWNKEWESNFEPITIDTRCRVRATFHSEEGDFDYDLVIDPKMSFGTGHHQTTRLLLEQLLHLDVSDQVVLDMGCGTGVLAILAAQRGARDIEAIDIDEWAYENTIENCKRNKCEQIRVFQGDSSLLGKQHFNVILANINKNVILRDLPIYADHLEPAGLLLLSGFYQADVPDVLSSATASGLHFKWENSLDGWAALMLQKQ